MLVGRPRGLDIEVSEKCGWKTKSSKMVNTIPDRRVILHTMIPITFDSTFFPHLFTQNLGPYPVVQTQRPRPAGGRC